MMRTVIISFVSFQVENVAYKFKFGEIRKFAQWIPKTCLKDADKMTKQITIKAIASVYFLWWKPGCLTTTDYQKMHKYKYY